MRVARIAFFLFLLQLAQTSAWAGFGGVAAVGELAQRADLVVVATIQQITDRELADGTSTETIDLLAVRVLKGREAELPLIAKVVPGPRPAIGILPRSFVGTTGVWFLKENSGILEVLPLVREFFEGRDLFVPVQVTGQSPAPTGTLSQEVLAYQLYWYESLPYPTPTEDDLMFASLVHNSGQDAGNAIAALRSWATPSHRIPGIAAAIRLGSSDAILQVARELETLRSKSNFDLLSSTIRGYLGAMSLDVVGALEDLAALHSDVPGLDDAIGKALAAGVGDGFMSAKAPPRSKANLHAMMLLLDSKDSAARLRSARFFAHFAQFADADGGIPGTAMAGPFASSEARRFDPAEGLTMSSTRYAQFWKKWCAQNRKQLGF